MNGAVPQLRLYTFMACTGKSFYSFLPLLVCLVPSVYRSSWFIPVEGKGPASEATCGEELDNLLYFSLDCHSD
jgi:hypothetical protein